MAKIGDSLICCLLIFNTLGIFTTFFCVSNGRQYLRCLNEKYEINTRQNNLRGSKLINKIQQDLDINNYNHLSYKEDKLNNYKIKLEYISNKKNIRRLSSAFHDIIIPMLVLDGISFYFCIILMISFCIDNKNNYSSNNNNYNMNSNSNSNSNSKQTKSKSSGASDCGNCSGCGDAGGLGIVLLVLLVAVLVVIITYGLTKGIGKHASRYVSLIVLIILHLLASLLCINNLFTDNGIINYIIGGVSLFLVVINILGILLPNLNCCQILRYDYNPNSIKNNNPMSQNNNDKTTLLDKKSISTQLDIERNAYDSEKNYEKPKNKQINDFREESPRYSDYGNAPTPAVYDLPTENEIYKNQNV